MKDFKKIAPELSKTNNKNPFNVPDGYFDSFPVRMSDRIHQQEKQEVYRHTVPVLKPYYIIGTVFTAVLITVVFLLIWPVKTIHEPTRYEVARFVDDDIYHYSEDAIIETLQKQDKPSANYRNKSDKEEIIDYLINENISLDEIIDAL